MATFRTGYYRIPPAEIGATLVFVPRFTGGLSVLELALWATQHGFGEIAYVPARAILKPDTGVEA